MTDPAEGCACCHPCAPTTDASLSTAIDSQHGPFVDGLLELGIDGAELTQLTELRDAGDCGAVRQRLAQVVTARLNATQLRIVELIEDAARLQAEAADTLGTPPSVAEVQLEIVNLGGLSARWQAAVGPLTGPSSPGAGHDDCPCSLAIVPSASSPVRLPAGRMALTLQGLVQPDSALACTLDGGVDAMRERISQWQAAIAPATGRYAVDGGVALTFAHDADLVVELARLAAAEYACCSFFTFALTVDSQGVRFEARAPEEARDVISAVFGVAALLQPASR